MNDSEQAEQITTVGEVGIVEFQDFVFSTKQIERFGSLSQIKPYCQNMFSAKGQIMTSRPGTGTDLKTFSN